MASSSASTSATAIASLPTITQGTVDLMGSLPINYHALAPQDTEDASFSQNLTDTMSGAIRLMQDAAKANSSALVDDQALWSDSETTSYKALLVINSISGFACVMVLAAYFIMSRRYPRIMGRLSLRLCACMAGSELVLHMSSLVGYGKLSQGGVFCALFGGALYAGPSLLSLFYTCSIALNCQLVFAFAKRPSKSREKYFIWCPLIAALLICVPSLAAGVYGYDDEYQYCWFATQGVSNRTVLVRMVTTYGLWFGICIIYLLVSTVMIIKAVFNCHSAGLDISASMDGFAAPCSNTDVISRRSTAVRRLTYRLLGYLSIPMLCFVSGVILDILAKSGVPISSSLDAGFECLSGLCGTFNGILFMLDPAVLAVKDLRWKEIEEREHTIYLNRQTTQSSANWSPRTLTSARGMDLEKNVYGTAAAYMKKFQDLERDLEGL